MLGLGGEVVDTPRPQMFIWANGIKAKYMAVKKKA